MHDESLYIYIYIYPEECLLFIIIEIIKNMLLSWTDDQAKSHSILFLEEIQSLNGCNWSCFTHLTCWKKFEASNMIELIPYFFLSQLNHWGNFILTCSISKYSFSCIVFIATLINFMPKILKVCW